MALSDNDSDYELLSVQEIESELDDLSESEPEHPNGKLIYL